MGYLARIILTISMFVLPQLLHAVDQTRFALVVGNAAYEGIAPLKNPVNDAEDVSTGLSEIGWKVTKVTNATKLGFTRAVKKFRDEVALVKGATVLFYYSGHGVQFRDSNYLIPVRFDEAPQDEEELASQSYSVKELTDTLNEGLPATTIVVLDACRDNPFAKTKTRSSGPGNRGLAVVSMPSADTQSAVIFSTAPGTTASDGQGRNGVFTSAFLTHLKDNAQLTDLMNQVTADVQRETKGQQKPFITYNMTESFYLLGNEERLSRAEQERQTSEKLKQKELAHAAESARLAEAEKTKEAIAIAEAAKRDAVAAQAAQAEAEAKLVGLRADANRVTMGSLSVSADLPGALALLDGGSDFYDLPHVFEPILPGKHSIKILPLQSGPTHYSGAEYSISVNSGESSRISHVFAVGFAKLKITGVQKDATLIMDNRDYLTLDDQADGLRLFEGDVTAGSHDLRVELGNTTWLKHVTLGIGKSQTIDVSSMNKQVVLVRQSVQLTGSDKDFAGMEPVFGSGEMIRNKKPQTSGSQISQGYLCYDTSNLYLRIDFSNGPPDAWTESKRTLIFHQGSSGMTISFEISKDGKKNIRLQEWEKSVERKDGLWQIGSGFIEIQVPLSSFQKSFFFPGGIDMKKAVIAELEYSSMVNGDGNVTPSVTILFRD